MSSVWNFLKRHRRKIAFSGLILGGGILAAKFALQKLYGWQEKEVNDYYELLKKDQHFETTRKTCAETINSLSSNLKSSILMMLDSDALTCLLKMKPPNKLEIWDELKIIGFVRPVALIYSCSMLIVFINVQMNILGGYLYVESTRPNKTVKFVLSHETQQQFLAIVQYFLNDGLQSLVNELTSVVKSVVGPLSLKDKVSLSDMENIFGNIKKKFEESSSSPCKNLCFLLSAVRQPIANPSSLENESLLKILNETSDVLMSEDCQQVFLSTVNSGFALLADSLAGCYLDKRNEDDSFVNPKEIQLPLAKLIPFLCNLIHVQCSSQHGELLQSLVQLEKIKLLGANVYEAFSQHMQ